MDMEKRLQSLREELRERNLDAYIVTGTDPHQSEYVAPRWRTRAFISGFTGSAGTVIITLDKALLWVDSRYFIQAAEEISGTEYVLMKLETEGTPDPWEWLKRNMAEGSTVGVDGSSISIALFSDLSSLLKEGGITLAATGDLLDPLWEGRPEVPCTPCCSMPADTSGESAASKVGRIRDFLRSNGLRWTFIASIDDIAWLTNLRADDIPCNPVFVSYAFISLSKAVLFADSRRFDRELLKSVKAVFDLRPYEDAAQDLPKLAKGPGYYSPDKVSQVFSKALSGKRNVTGRDITTDMKTCKNEAELRGMRLAHIYDAAAYVSFLARLDMNGEYDEIAVSAALEAERKKIPSYLGPSFNPISGYREHGAMCHYSATPETSSRVHGHGLLVLDTGSQFEFGTTDITRTLLFGDEATEDEKRDYTLVLKGHLALSRQRFIKGTRGVQLDVLAKQFLWQNGESFYHGTGHGVGCRLNVHEGPLRISSALIDVPLRPGMVTSDEPGLYKEGRYGIRIENLLAVREDMKTEFGEFYSFEVLTLVPYEKRLIDTELLTDEEKSQINAYHKRIYSELHELVDPDVLRWLGEATSPL